jgi:hypothetical protein
MSNETKTTSATTSKTNIKFVALDISGSTDNSGYYYTCAKSIIESIDDNAKSVYCLWNINDKIVSRKEIINHINTKKGTWGTSPSCFIKHLDDGYNLCIITDGEIDNSELSKCLTSLQKIQFENVEIYFINSNENNMNLSVSAPFIKNAKSFEIFVNGVKNSSGSTLQVIPKLKSYFGKPDVFLKEFDTIWQSFVALTIGVNDHKELHNLIVALNESLQIAIKQSLSKGLDYSQMLKEIRNKSGNPMSEISRLITVSNNSIAKDVDARIQKLLSQLKNTSNYSFSTMNSNRLLRAEETKTDLSDVKEDLSQEDLSKATNLFECQISMDDQIACLPIKNGDPILKHLIDDTTKKTYLDIILTNPLYILNDDNIMQKFIDRLCQPIGSETFTKLRNDPFTRKTYSAGFVFANDISYKETSDNSHVGKLDMNSVFMNANKHALADLLFGKKLVGNINLWMMVLWIGIHRVPFLKDNKEFMGTLEKFFTEFMDTSHTSITLSGIPMNPTINAPASVAIWYCVHSWLLLNQHRTEDTVENRLRSFGTTAKHLFQLMDLLDIVFDRKRHEHMVDLWGCFSTMMYKRKQNENLEKQIATYYQNWMQLSNGNIILLDYKSDKEWDGNKYLSKLTKQEIFGLYNKVDISKSNNTIMIQENTSATIPSAQKNYGYDNSDEHKICEVPICPYTMRPYLFDQSTGKPWNVQSEISNGCSVDKQLHTTKYFAEYVVNKNKYPNREEFIQFMADKQLSSMNNIMTLPIQVVGFADSVLDDYAKVLGKNFDQIQPSEFVKRYLDSIYINTRAIIEKKGKDSNSDKKDKK